MKSLSQPLCAHVARAHHPLRPLRLLTAAALLAGAGMAQAAGWYAPAQPVYPGQVYVYPQPAPYPGPVYANPPSAPYPGRVYVYPPSAPEAGQAADDPEPSPYPGLRPDMTAQSGYSDPQSDAAQFDESIRRGSGAASSDADESRDGEWTDDAADVDAFGRAEAPVPRRQPAPANRETARAPEERGAEAADMAMDSHSDMAMDSHSDAAMDSHSDAAMDSYSDAVTEASKPSSVRKAGQDSGRGERAPASASAGRVTPPSGELRDAPAVILHPDDAVAI